MRKVDVVIPVYKGLEETRRCLESVLATIDSDGARVVVINDGSPEPGISAYLRELAATDGQLVLLENVQNLGFVATVNRGMQYDTQCDVLLLNSDVEVANDWLHRMRMAAYQNEKVASLTPFSNNATICSFPEFCSDNKLPFGLPLAEIDACFTAQFGPEDVIPVPTGVGCCMYLRRAGLSPSERLLRGIWRFSRSPIVAKCVALVPFRLKQSFKRRLSSRPMHDIVHKE